MGFWKVLFSAGIGWWMGGPLGAIIGVIIGNMVKTDVQTTSRPYAKQHEGFVASLLAPLSASEIANISAFSISSKNLFALFPYTIYPDIPDGS